LRHGTLISDATEFDSFFASDSASSAGAARAVGSDVSDGGSALPEAYAASAGVAVADESSAARHMMGCFMILIPLNILAVSLSPGFTKAIRVIRDSLRI
jgi:hypothetical protein